MTLVKILMVIAIATIGSFIGMIALDGSLSVYLTGYFAGTAAMAIGQ
jgi:hypothetical protein